jgi:hypothetical protein
MYQFVRLLSKRRYMGFMSFAGLEHCQRATASACTQCNQPIQSCWACSCCGMSCRRASVVTLQGLLAFQRVKC